MSKVKSKNIENCEEELVAVLTAAVSEIMQTPSYNIKIKNFKQINSNSSIWNQVGRIERIASKLN